jgi:hypothetical protein
MSYLIWSGQYFVVFLSTKFEKTTVKQGPQITWYLWFVYLLIDCSFENVISSSDYTAFDGRIINELEVAWRKWPWPNDTLPQYFLGDTEENHFSPQSWERVSGLRFEPGIFWIWSTRINKLTATFDVSTAVYQVNGLSGPGREDSTQHSISCCTSLIQSLQTFTFVY